MNEMIAFALCGLIAFHLGLFLQKFIRPDVKGTTGFPFGVTAVALGIGMFFHAFAFLRDWIAPLFLVFLVLFLGWRLWAKKLGSEAPGAPEARPASEVTAPVAKRAAKRPGKGGRR